jgi:uncharacterized RDD family membrane protein YckC
MISETKPGHSQLDTSAFADQLSIETPEQVALRFPIAGIGSRFLAYLTDTAIHVAVAIAVLLAIILISAAVPRAAARTGSLSDTATKWFVAAIILFIFLVYWAYYALFEAFWNGQTPGKRLLKIRVIKDSGRRITLFEALARNLLRFVDAQPGVLTGAYLVGVVTMLCNRQQKRLGDLVAGTIVIHERLGDQPILTHSSRTFTAPLSPNSQPYEEPALLAAQQNAALLPADAIARLDHHDLDIIDTFFSRALDLDLNRRAEVASRIASRMCAKMQIPLPDAPPPERLLEAIAHAMRAHARH